MIALRIVVNRLCAVFRRRRLDCELDEEMRTHLALLADEHVRRGLSPDAAREAAQRSFGSVLASAEAHRLARSLPWLDVLRQDLRFAVRQLLRYRAFSAAAVAALALGIAASVAIFGFVDAALVRPLPYEEPSRLVTVFGARPELAASQSRGNVSYPDFRDWQERHRAFQSMAACDVRAGFTLLTAEGPERVSGLRVSSGFFRTLGVRPLLGRDFRRDEEGPAAPAAVMLSHQAWRTRFDGDPGVVGRSVTLQTPWLADARPHLVIGVLPPDFHFALAAHAEFWTTIDGVQGCWGRRSCRSLEVVARLADGASAPAASANMTGVLDQLRREYPDEHRNPETAKLVPLADVTLGNVRPVLLMLLTGAGLLLAIACINVVSLLLARTDGRAREIAVRAALGASSGRLVLQFAMEALMLAAVAAGLGLMLASWGIGFLTSLLSADTVSRMPYLQGIGVNLRLVLFACAVSAGAATLFALTPLLRLSAATRLSVLNEAGRGSSGRSWRRLGANLVVAELAVAVLLLAGAGLLGKSTYELLHVETGFETQALATLAVTPVSSGRESADSDGKQAGALAHRVAERVGGLPGVESVGYADSLPLGPGLAPASSFWIAGRAEEGQQWEDWPVRRVSAHYFGVLQAKLLRGRYFTAEEVAVVRPVLIINETAARRYFPGENPIGRSIAFGSPSSPAREIVGVVADIKDGPPETRPHPSAYIPFDQTGFNLVIRTRAADQSLYPSLVAAVREVRPDALVGKLATMTERMQTSPSASLNRSSAWLVAGFAAMALILSIVGLYGLVTYSVSQRTREIGIRMALGAERRLVFRLVLGETVRLVAIGASLGAIGAVAAASLMRRLLFAVQPWDPLTLVAAVCLLTISALVATYIPARYAAAVNPVEVLRAE
jgi:macrolide transport system ATP-binding/permease protein